WTMRSIDSQGKDLADVAVDINGGQRLDGITIVLSNTLPKVRGTRPDAKHQPAEGTVLIFPEDSAKWGENSRLIRTTRPDLSGGVGVADVSRGRFTVVWARC